MKGAVAGLSGSLALALLLPMEAGVPIPVPADLVMFAVGERVAAGKFPLWLAVTGFEVIAVRSASVPPALGPARYRRSPSTYGCFRRYSAAASTSSTSS